MLHTIYEHPSGAKLYLASKANVKEAKERNFDAVYIYVPGRVDFISSHHNADMNVGAVSVYVQWIDKELTVGNNVVVYCNGGMERSPLVCACYLYEGALDLDLDLNEAYAMVIKAKGDVLPREYLLPRWYVGE